MKKSFFTSFAALNLAQFFAALNDNVYKLLLVFLLITIEGAQHSNTILSLAGAIFVIPFLIFASLAGTLADHFSKRSIIYITRILELLIVSGGVVAIAFKSAIGGYTVLFLMATQSTLFSPAKYGIIPEIVKKEKISHYNGIMTATTYLAIILGTFLASFLADITHKNFFIASTACVLIAIFGAISSLGIEKTKAQAEEKEVSTRLFTAIFHALKGARKIRYLLPAILFGSYFLFMGSYAQLNIIPFAMQSLHLTEIQGGYLFLMTAIGIGFGAFAAGRLSKEEVELGFVPLAALGIALTLLILFLFQSQFSVVIPALVVLGVFGGFYVVPIDSFIQTASPNEDRGQNVATYNFLSFLGVIIASFLIAFLGNGLGFSAAQGFLTVSFITFVMGITLLTLMADQVLRLIVAKVGRPFWKLKVVGKKNLKFQTPVLLVGERTSWLDTIVVMSTLPRLIRYIVPFQGHYQTGYRLLRLIPLHKEHFAPQGQKMLSTIRKEIQAGHSVCLMQPVTVKSDSLKEWSATLNDLIREISVPIIPIRINRAPPEKKGVLSEIASLFKTPIEVTFGNNSNHN